MSGQWKGVLGPLARWQNGLSGIASHPPTVDNISGTLDKKSAGVDKLGARSRAEEGAGTANLRQTLAGFTDSQIDTCRAWLLGLVGINVPFANRARSRAKRVTIARQPGGPFATAKWLR